LKITVHLITFITISWKTVDFLQVTKGVRNVRLFPGCRDQLIPLLRKFLTVELTISELKCQLNLCASQKGVAIYDGINFARN
jgi:hypothetical protein